MLKRDKSNFYITSLKGTLEFLYLAKPSCQVPLSILYWTDVLFKSFLVLPHQEKIFENKTIFVIYLKKIYASIPNIPK